MDSSKRKLYMGIFIIFIMISSTAGFIASYSTNTGNVNIQGKNFINQGNYWILRENNNEYNFYYLPDQISGYNEIKLSNNIYLNIDELSEHQINRLSYFLAVNNVKFQFIDEVNCEGNNDILIIRTGVNNIYKDDKCLFLEGDIEQSIDKIGYSLILL